MTICENEAGENQQWLEVIVEADILPWEKVKWKNEERWRDMIYWIRSLSGLFIEGVPIYWLTHRMTSSH